MNATATRLGGCARRRCRRAATVVVSFQAPHPLAGTSRAYCQDDAVQVAGQSGAVLTGTVGRAPALPGLDPPAESGWSPAWGGGW